MQKFHEKMRKFRKKREILWEKLKRIYCFKKYGKEIINYDLIKPLKAENYINFLTQFIEQH